MGAWEWTYDRDRLEVAIYNRDGVKVYGINLDRCGTCAELLDWIVQLSHKEWLPDDVFRGLVLKLDSLLNIQGNYCPGGRDGGRIKVRELLNRADIRPLNKTKTPLRRI